MTMRWDNSLSIGLREVRAKAGHMQDDAFVGGQVILARSNELVPKEDGDLASSGNVRRDRGGVNAVGITYSGPYARYQHEHTWFKHPRGGVAKFLELAMVEQGPEAVNKAGQHFWGRL